MSIEAMKQAMHLIDAWERGAYAEEYPNEIDALRQAIEQAEKQEPSRAQTKQIVNGLKHCHYPDSQHEFLRVWIKDWTTHKSAPPRKEWVGLTVDEIVELSESEENTGNVWMALNVQAKLKEKNT